MRRHSAVLDDSFVPDLDKGKPLPPLPPLPKTPAPAHYHKDTKLICTVDEETGLSRVTESRATLRAGEDGMFKNAKAKLANGFGLRR